MHRRAALLVSGLAVATASAPLACSRAGRRAAPVATLASSSESAAALSTLHDAWGRRAVDPAKARAFLAAYPKDGAAPLVKVYLAFALIEAGRLIEADGVLAALGDLPAGTTRDLATVARARSLRLHGAPQSALDALRPLVGKVVDEADREVFLEELALAAIGAHTDYEALAYLDAWLRGVNEEDRDRVRVKIAEILETLPRPVLEQTYRTMRERGTASGYGPETQKLVANRLARVAVEQNDAALARWLLETSGVTAVQAGGDAGVELGELAASRRGLDVVSGRTIGLVLPMRDRALRDEAADVVRGLSWALDLPRSASGDGGIRLLTREEGEGEDGTRAAMEELAGEGAAVVIAGFDRVGAERALAFGDAHRLSVVALAAPASSARVIDPKGSGFVLGERPQREITMLVDALRRRGVKTAALVAEGEEEEATTAEAARAAGLPLLAPVRCDVPLSVAGKPRFPVEAWSSANAGAVLVAGASSCARDVLRDVSGLRSGRVVALTLEAAVPFEDVPRRITVVSASAGIVPVLTAKPEEIADADVRAFVDRLGVRPSYWAALGRDAGAIARAAVAPLPPDTTSDERAVAQRRAVVRAGLLGARIPLWTSDDRGFGADRTLPRALRLVTLSAP